MSKIIKTDRLTLRPWLDSDAEALYKYASERKVSEMALWPCHNSIEMSRRVIHDFFIPNPLNFAMTMNTTGEPIGCIGLVPTGEENYPTLINEREVGYWIGLPYWGKGLTTEALSDLIRICRDDLHLNSLLLTTRSDNIASQRVAEKCGFSFITDVKKDATPIKIYRLYIAYPQLKIYPVLREKTRFLDLLLIGDESENMIMKYLDSGNMFISSIDDNIVSVIVVNELTDNSVEIKNLAVVPEYRRKGIGRTMLELIENIYHDKNIYIGTGETPSTLRFYHSCGYEVSHVIPDFFTQNYPNPIIEYGVQLKDMIYLYKKTKTHQATTI